MEALVTGNKIPSILEGSIQASAVQYVQAIFTYWHLSKLHGQVQYIYLVP